MKRVILILLFPVLMLGADTINFGSDTPGAVPKGWSVNMTHPGGAPKWEVVADKTAPSKKPFVVGQTSNSPDDNRFPLLIYDNSNLKDGEVSVAFKPISGKIDQGAGVVDLKTRKQTTAWPTGVNTNVALALDESHHRLFDGVRDPATLMVQDTESGKQVSRVEGVSGIDDLWYDAAHKRVYASGGRGFETGFVYAYQQKDADHYELIGKVPTAPGAGTSFWSPELNRIYVAAPSNGKEEAAVLVFEPEP